VPLCILLCLFGSICWSLWVIAFLFDLIVKSLWLFACVFECFRVTLASRGSLWFDSRVSLSWMVRPSSEQNNHRFSFLASSRVRAVVCGTPVTYLYVILNEGTVEEEMKFKIKLQFFTSPYL